MRDIEPEEIQVSQDVVSLYPFLSFDKAIDVIMGQLKNNFEDFSTRKILTLKTVHQLIKLCISEWGISLGKCHLEII